MHQVVKVYSLQQFGGLVTSAVCLSLGTSPSKIHFLFHKKKIFPTFFFFFCAYVAVVPSSTGLSVVCVYTEILKFQATSSLALQAPLTSSKPPVQSCVVSEHVSCIHPGSFHCSPPLHINIVCWMGISGRSCVETLEYLLFKGLVPYAVLVRGGAKVCVW